jgi:hypothetical protein
VKSVLLFGVNFLYAYLGSLSCINAYIFKGLLGHKIQSLVLVIIEEMCSVVP